MMSAAKRAPLLLRLSWTCFWLPISNNWMTARISRLSQKALSEMSRMLWISRDGTVFLVFCATFIVPGHSPLRPPASSPDAAVIALVAQPVEHRHAIAVAGYSLAVDQAGEHLESIRGRGDQREAADPIVPVAGEKPHARRVAAHQHSEASCLISCSQPAPAGGFALG